MNFPKKIRNQKKPNAESLSSIYQNQESSAADSLTDVAFFFGAGASVAAGVPDTFSFVEKFIQTRSSPEREYVIAIKNELNKWGEKQKPPRIVDIELLLEALEVLVKTDENLVLPFYRLQQSLLPSGCDPAAILTNLRNFIREKVIVDVPAIEYLGPLRGFVQNFSPLDIYSANYDTCIELFCSEHKLEYKDGFDESWNPRVFEDDNIDIFLYKIHGSATWYRSNRGRYIKVPILNAASNVELITKERAEGLMLYPAQKFEYVEPLFELLIRMKEKLLFCQTLFVIGYSFRDDHIRRMFWDIARRNRKFTVVLISPSAWSIYKNRLKNYEDGKTPSSLAGRVICLPYKFQYVLPYLRDDFLRSITHSRTCINDQNKITMSGRRASWTTQCILSIAKAGDIEALRQALDEDVQKYTRFYSEILESIIWGIFYAAADTDQEMYIFFWNKFKSLYQLMIGHLSLNLNNSQIQVVQFSDSNESPHDVFRMLSEILPQMNERREWLKSTAKDDNEHISVLMTLLQNLHQELSIWNAGYVNFENYLANRKKYLDKVERVEDIYKTETMIVKSVVEKYDEKIQEGASSQGPL